MAAEEWNKNIFRLIVNQSNYLYKKLQCFINLKSITFNFATDDHELCRMVSARIGSEIDDGPIGH